MSETIRKRSGAGARAPMVLGVMTGLAGFAVGWATGVEHMGWTMGLLVGWWPAMIVGAGAAWAVGIGLPYLAGAVARSRTKPETDD
jgi:hypothetical protein